MSPIMRSAENNRPKSAPVTPPQPPEHLAEWLEAPPRPAGEVPAIQRERFADGVVAEYRGAKDIELPKGDSTTLYEFCDGEGERYALWGSAMLRSQLSTVPVGAHVWIAFGGLAPHYSGDHRTVALWTVRVLKAGAPVRLTPRSTLLDESAPQSQRDDALPF